MHKLGQRVANESRRGLRLVALAFMLNLVWVPLLFGISGSHSADEMAVTAAVPLIVSYLMLKAVMWMASGAREMTDDEVRETEKLVNANTGNRTRASDVLGILFLIGVWLGVAGFLSFLTYWGIGLYWAMLGALQLVQAILIITAGSAVLLCLIKLCHPWTIRVARFFFDFLDRPLHFRLPAGH